MPKNVRDLGKLIVAKGFKKLPKVQKIAKSGHTASCPLFYLFSVFSNKQIMQYLQQINVKNVQMSIQYTVPGFEPQLLQHKSSPITTRPELPPMIYKLQPDFDTTLLASVPDPIKTFSEKIMLRSYWAHSLVENFQRANQNAFSLVKLKHKLKVCFKDQLQVKWFCRRDKFGRIFLVQMPPRLNNL